MTIWTDEVLNQLATDGAEHIALSANTIFYRFYQATVSGEGLIRLPQYVLGVRRVTWRGLKIDPIAWIDMEQLSLTEAMISNTDKVNASTGRPLWYSTHPTNIRDLRLYPTPNETFATTGDPYSPSPNEARCCISCWRVPDDSDPLLSIPPYVDRRTRKAFVAWKAFEMEGKGQSRIAANYYKQKFLYLLKQFGAINSGVFVSKRYGLSERRNLNRAKYPRPVLPSNFERVDYE
jgi:hypothetical protein